MILIPTLAVLYFTTIFFGGEIIWVYSIAELFILFFSFIFLLIFILPSKPAKKDHQVIDIDKDPVTLFGLLCLALVAFQLIPWPSGWLNILSPMSFEVWKRAPLPEGNFFPVSVYPYATKHGLIFTFCLLLVYWWVRYGIKDRREMEKLVLGIVVFGALVALYGLFETATGHDQILWWKKTFGQKTVTATFFNRNHLATFLSMSLLIGIVYFWTLWDSAKKGDATGGKKISRIVDDRIKNLGLKGLLILLSLLILVFTLLTTGSRGGSLSTLAGLILMAGLITHRFAKKRRVASFYLLIVAIIAFGAFAAGDQLWKRLKWESLEQIQSTAILNRPALYEDTWAIVKDYPSLGSGFNTFPYVFTRYAEHSPKYIDHAHNDWLELTAEIGWAGLLVILSGLFFTIYFLLKMIRSNPDPLAAGMIMGGMGVLSAVSLHALTDFSLHKPANAILLAIILGLAFRAGAGLRATSLKDQVGASRIPGPAGMTGLDLRNGGENRLFPCGYKGRVLITLFILTGFFICLWGANTVVRSFLMNLWVPVEIDETRERSDPGWEEAITAIRINPDNSAGWAWLSQTLQSEKNIIPVKVFATLREHARSSWARVTPRLPAHEYQVLFSASESLARRPVSSHYWYRLILGSKGLLGENPSFFVPLIAEAYDNVLFFDPRLAIGYFERGIFCLQSNFRTESQKKEACFPDIKKSLELEPTFVPLTIKAFENNAIPMSPLLNILPDFSQAWISAGENLLENNQVDLGETLYLKGELLKIKETEALGLRIKNQLHEGRASQLENLIGELMILDPGHPCIWYGRGEIIKALEQASKRGWPFRRLDEVSRLRSGLMNLNPGSDMDSLKIGFYLALFDFEQNNFKEAARRLDQVLKKEPSLYPALLAREQILNQQTKTEEEKNLLEQIRKRIRLFSMEEITSGGWVAVGKPEETEPRTYRAVLRNHKPLPVLKITTPIEAEGWMVLVDAQFVAARVVRGNPLNIVFPNPLRPGEHQVIIKPLKIAHRRETARASEK
jgi:O-antigen ligase